MDVNFLEQYLARASISDEVFNLQPDYRAVLIAISGICPGPSDEHSESLLVDAEASVRSSCQAVAEIPHVAAWRETYKAFGSKPNKFRNSLEALTRRIGPETGLPRVNRLTDIYNAISVKYQIPLGGEDLDKYSGPPRLIRATGTEVFEFKDKGEIKKEHPDPGEVVWVDDVGVTCRRWNWRQGPRTALTESTTNVLFICDALGAMSDDELETAVSRLVEEVTKLGPNVIVEKRLISSNASE